PSVAVWGCPLVRNFARRFDGSTAWGIRVDHHPDPHRGPPPVRPAEVARTRPRTRSRPRWIPPRQNGNRATDLRRDQRDGREGYALAGREGRGGPCDPDLRGERAPTQVGHRASGRQGRRRPGHRRGPSGRRLQQRRGHAAVARADHQVAERLRGGRVPPYKRVTFIPTEGLSARVPPEKAAWRASIMRIADS